MHSKIENEKIELLKLMKKNTDKITLKKLKEFESFNALKLEKKYTFSSKVE